MEFTHECTFIDIYKVGILSHTVHVPNACVEQTQLLYRGIE